jgi:hypothetical protein
MADVFRTLIVPFAQVDLARQVAAIFPGGEGMWTTPLSVDGLEPRTHYISSGYVPENYQTMVPCQYWEQGEDGEWVETGSYAGDPVAVYEAVTAAGVECTQAQINALFASADVTEQDPFVAMGRLNLQIISSGTP